MTINVNKLNDELIAAGIQISCCNEVGVVWAPDGTTEIQTQPEVAAVIAAHIAEEQTDDPAEQPTLSIQDQIAALQAQLDQVSQMVALSANQKGVSEVGRDSLPAGKVTLS